MCRVRMQSTTLSPGPGPVHPRKQTGHLAVACGRWHGTSSSMGPEASPCTRQKASSPRRSSCSAISLLPSPPRAVRLSQGGPWRAGGMRWQASEGEHMPGTVPTSRSADTRPITNEPHDRRGGFVPQPRGGGLPMVVGKTGRRGGAALGGAMGRRDGARVVEDPEVSRRHAVLRRSGGSVIVEDLDSTNGTFVNGERIRSPITVGPGGQRRVGGTTLEIEPDQRVDDTIDSTPPRPDRMRSAEAPPPSGGLSQEREDATQPLPYRGLESA